MLHRLEIENFHSIRERQVIDLVARGNVSNEDGRLAPLWPGSEELAPKVVAIFGANAAGKTNVLRALQFLTKFIQEAKPAPNHWHLRFLSSEAKNADSYFCAHFAGPNDLKNLTSTASPEATGCRYAYEVTLKNSLTHGQSVASERLLFWPNHARRQIRIFERIADEPIKFHRDFGINRDYQGLLNRGLRENASLIATLADANHPIAQALIRFVSQTFFYFQSEGIIDFSTAIPKFYQANIPYLDALNKDMERIGLGVQKMELRPNGDHWISVFHHEGLEEPLISTFESSGTQQYVRLFPFIAKVLDVGGVAVIDELDQALHPLVLNEVVRWFHDPIRNPHNAQLWMTCQNASLLHELDKEEVLFCEKDSKGQTSVYSLADVKGARRGEDFYKKYLGGVYGAVPHIG